MTLRVRDARSAAFEIREPCAARPDELRPTSVGSFCGRCGTDVYDVHRLSDADFEALLERAEREPICVRIREGPSRPTPAVAPTTWGRFALLLVLLGVPSGWVASGWLGRRRVQPPRV